MQIRVNSNSGIGNSGSLPDSRDNPDSHPLDTLLARFGSAPDAEPPAQQTAAPAPVEDVQPIDLKALDFHPDESSLVEEDRLTPPPGATVYLCREDARECEPGDTVFMWTWEHAPRWYYAAQDPPPFQPPPKRERVRRQAEAEFAEQ